MELSYGDTKVLLAGVYVAAVKDAAHLKSRTELATRTLTCDNDRTRAQPTTCRAGIPGFAHSPAEKKHKKNIALTRKNEQKRKHKNTPRNTKTPPKTRGKQTPIFALKLNLTRQKKMPNSHPPAGNETKSTLWRHEKKRRLNETFYPQTAS